MKRPGGKGERRERPATKASGPSKRSIGERALWAIAASALLTVPLFISPTGDDAFRIPKLLLFRAFCLLIIAAAAAVCGDEELRNVFRPPAALLALAILGWTLISAAFASHRANAFASAFDVACGVAFFLAVLKSGRGRQQSGVILFLIPAAVNSIVYLAQHVHPWDRFLTNSNEHMAKTALLGNPNDVGVFLVAPALVAIGFAIADKRKRVVFAATAALIVIAILTTQTLTAIVAACAGTLAMWFQQQQRRSVVFTAAATLALAGIVLLYPPSRERVAHAVRDAKAGEWNSLLTGRLSAYVPAWEMFLDHPWTGVGAGGFAPNYFDYRLRSIVEHPQLTYWPPGLGIAPNFDAAHSDHLQILAETGIVGYALFLAAFLMFLRGGSSERSGALDRLRLPLVVAISTLALAEFPFQTAATAMPLLFIVALCEAGP
jgi:O-antigen ligase